MSRKTREPGKIKIAKPSKAKPEVSSRKPITKEVKVGRAKGRPMLVWVGKRPLDRVTVFPAQLVETYNPTSQKVGSQNLLFHGDNKEVLAWLLANGFRGKVNLIYIDPPFDSGADYVREVQLRGVAGTSKLEGESYTLGEQIQYTDIWANDNYLQFMYERLLLLRELLTSTGVLWLHCDWNRSHQLRVVLDEIFGPESLLNEIVWQRISAHPDSKFFGHVHDILFLYAKDPDEVTFNTIYSPYSEEFVKRYFTKDDDDGRGLYWTGDLTAPGPRPGLDYEFKGRRPPPGRVWFTLKEKLLALDEGRRIYWPESGVPKLKRYLKEYPGIPTTSLWTDIKSLAGLGAPATERLDFPTQKPEALLDRVIRSTPNVGGLILDCFIGSGTSAAVAQKLGCRWIGCDINKGAIQTTTKRLQTVIEEQLATEKDGQKQGKLIETGKVEQPPKPASLSFSVYRVNDYDLQIQHNEAANLACEHVGVERTYTDRYFDGKLGKRLVKIVPFNHPLSPLDLEELKNELKARPEEDRDITVISLGKETACDAWLEEWNRMRRQGRVPNQIEVIELRTDPKYGKFFVHKPAKAEVKIARQKDKITITISDFLSPTIIERLSAQDGVLKPQITDWRSMVDTVMIDTAYDGQVFNIVLADVPERKTDLVQGRYELPAPKSKTTVAVKITEMLGEEVLVTREI